MLIRRPLTLIPIVTGSETAIRCSVVPSTMADWTAKYRPTTLQEVRGNDSARDDLQEWAATWDEHGEAVVLHGSPGVGKTSAAQALANDMDWPVTEMNASDQRTADVVERVAGEAARNSTLTQSVQGETGRRLVILDEADNLHGNADRGGSRAMADVVESASQPLVLVANDFYEMSRSLRDAVREIEFRDVAARSIVPALRDVCRREGIEFEEAALEAIAESTDGDLRSAINDLQAVTEGRDSITTTDVVTSGRDRTEGIFDYLDGLLQEATPQEALRRSYDVDETPNDLVRWIEENVTKEYEGREVADAYRWLARADRWLGRVRATQNYSYWRYAGDAMTAGVASARAGRHGGWTRYGPPQWRTRGSTREEIARRIAERSGCSVATARREVLPFLAVLTHHCKNRELTTRMAAEYELDASEVAAVTGSGETTNKVQSIVEAAEDRREAAAAAASRGAFSPAPAEDGTDGDGDGVDGDGGGGGESDDDQTTPDAAADGGDGADAESDVDDEESDPAERAPTAEENDQQSGLGDFV
jgi:replication factor C large subunit